MVSLRRSNNYQPFSNGTIGPQVFMTQLNDAWEHRVCWRQRALYFSIYICALLSDELKSPWLNFSAVKTYPSRCYFFNWGSRTFNNNNNNNNTHSSQHAQLITMYRAPISSYVIASLLLQVEWPLEWDSSFVGIKYGSLFILLNKICFCLLNMFDLTKSWLRSDGVS